MMIFPSLCKFTHRTTLSLCLAFSLCALVIPARADNPPKFKDPAVTAFFQRMSDTIDSLLAAVKAKDDGKVKELSAKLVDTAKDGDALRTKVTPEEDATASKWGEAQMQKLTDAGWNPVAQ